MPDAANLNEVPSLYLIKTSLNLKDYAYITSNQAPDTELARSGDLGGLTSSEARIASRMLRFSADPLPVPLWRLETAQERQAAIALFDKLRDWCALSNSEMDRDRRNSLEEEILLLIQGSRGLRCELYLQLVKQTRGNPSLELQWTNWLLFSIVTGTVRCPEVIVGFILNYVEIAARSKTKSGLVMHLASKTCFTLMERVDEVYLHYEALEMYKTCKIPDEEGTPTDVYYAPSTKVEEAIRQLAWHKGVPCIQYLYLFSISDSVYRLLDRNSSLGTNIETNPVTFLLVKETFRRRIETNPTELNMEICFQVCQHSYLQGKYPVDDADVLNNCKLLLVANRRLDLLQNRRSLAQTIESYVPANIISRKSCRKWAKLVIKATRRINQGISYGQARELFMEKVDAMEYSNCYVFGVDRILQPTLIARRSQKITVAANKNGVHIFRDNPPRPFYSVSIDQFAFVTFSDGVFKLKDSDRNIVLAMTMDPADGALLLDLTKTHKSDHEWVLQNTGNSLDEHNPPEDGAPPETVSYAEEKTEADVRDVDDQAGIVVGGTSAGKKLLRSVMAKARGRVLRPSSSGNW